MQREGLGVLEAFIDEREPFKIGKVELPSYGCMTVLEAIFAADVDKDISNYEYNLQIAYWCLKSRFNSSVTIEQLKRLPLNVITAIAKFVNREAAEANRKFLEEKQTKGEEQPQTGGKSTGGSDTTTQQSNASVPSDSAVAQSS
jgi:hypothetical protein